MEESENPGSQEVDLGFGVLSGLIAAGFGLAVGELLAGLSARSRSPIAVIGDGVIDLVPQAIERWAINLFGTNDKAVLLVGILISLVVLASSIGVKTLGSARPTIGVLGATFAGLVAAAVGLTGRQGGIESAVSCLGAGVASAVALWAFHHKAHATATDKEPLSSQAVPLAIDRRRFLVMSTYLGVSGVAVGGIGRVMQNRFRIAGERAAIIFPKAKRILPSPALDPALKLDGLSSLFTPQSRFYRIDTAFVTPRVSIDDWTLKITGLVKKPMTLDFDDLINRPLIETDVTIACVSNEVGGDLIGNARWLGVRLDDLLNEAGIDPGADQIVGRSVDGWTGGFPVSTLDGRDCIIAVGMNGEPLNADHGYPARLVIPGLYGYVSATKWLSEIELTRFDKFEGYWVPRGWSALGPIKTHSRIDTPRKRTIDAIETAIAGVAWSPLHGITAVDVRIDDGPWQRATLGPEQAKTTWRQWWWTWKPTPGDHTVQCRATDGSGYVQTEETQDVIPDGATGLHTISISARSV